MHPVIVALCVFNTSHNVFKDKGVKVTIISAAGAQTFQTEISNLKQRNKTLPPPPPVLQPVPHKALFCNHLFLWLDPQLHVPLQTFINSTM